MATTRRTAAAGTRPLGIGMLAIGLLALGLSACGVARRSSPSTPVSPDASGRVALPVGSSTQPLAIGGRTRTFRVYRPATLADPAALVVMLHGGFGNAGQAESSYGWDAMADRGHFAVAYPDGVGSAWNVDGANIGGSDCCGKPAQEHVDDVAFITAVVHAVESQLPIDTRRVYATGISNGGMMTYRMACDTDLFAAIGPDSTTLLGSCPHPERVSVIHIHGLADHTIPFDGSQGTGRAEIHGPSVPSVVAMWRAVDGCAPPTASTQGTVTTSVASCPDGRNVDLITIAGAGHQWPGGKDHGMLAERLLGLDPPSHALDATSTIWDFFAAHPKP